MSGENNMGVLQRYNICPKCKGEKTIEMQFRHQDERYTKVVICKRCKGSGEIDLLRESWSTLLINIFLWITIPIVLLIFLHLLETGLAAGAAAEKGLVPPRGIFEVLPDVFGLIFSFLYIVLVPVCLITVQGLAWLYSLQIIIALSKKKKIVYEDTKNDLIEEESQTTEYEFKNSRLSK